MKIPIWRVIVRLVRNMPGRYFASLFFWILIWSMPLFVGVISAAFFDTLTDQPAGWNIPTVIAAAWGYAVSRVLVIVVAMRLHSSLLFRTGSAMRRSMLRWLYRLPGAQPVEETPGEVVSRFRDDVNHTTEAFDFTVDLISALVSAAIAIAVLIQIDPFITAVVFTPIALVIFITSRLGQVIRRYRTEARDKTEAITGFLGEMLGSVQSVKVADAEAPMLRHFEALNDERRLAMVRDRTFTAGIEAVFHNTVSIGTGLILVLVAGSLSIDGSGGGLTIGEFTIFVVFLQMVTDSAWFIGVFLARLRQAEVSVERGVALMRGSAWSDLVDRIDLESTLEVSGVPDHGTDPRAPLVTTRDLSFTYETSGAGIADVDLDIAPGSFTVVTGKIGAGKTTLLRVILGLLPASSGSITWKGSKVSEPEAFMVPPRAAYTPQVPRLFSMSLRDNLLLGHDVGDEELRAAVRTATMERDLAAMSEGFDTLVGPRGVRLSGGQVQRSAAARMLVRGPELLVFDDVSSALDVETEAMLWDRIFEENTGSTALVVSHRRPALMRADQIVVMDAGRVVDVGDASELLERSELFRDLWGT